MASVSGERQLDRSEQRLETLLGYLPYFALGVSAVLACTVPIATARSLRSTLLLSAGALGWLVLRSVMDHRALDRGRPWAAGAHFAVQIALICQLVLSTPVFGFFAFSGYVHAIRYLKGRRRMAGIAVTTLPTALSQIGGALPVTPGLLGVYGVALCFNLVVVGVVITLGEVTERLSAQRKQANAALSQANERLAAMLAENAGLHAQLIGQAREAGVTDERQRMAREIHDTVAQGLAGIVTQLQAADQVREHGGTDLAHRRHLDNAARLARESLTDARRAVRALRPEPLEHAELPAAIGEVVDSWRELHNLPAQLTVTGTAVPLHPEVEVTLLRAAQEALNNAAKHAAATRVGLTLSYMEDVVTLDVRDDGAGFDPSALPDAAGRPAGENGGFGLTAMRQRVRRLAGTLEIESEPGGGTALSATVPAVAREAARG
ncbi:sensor histidine kinase [Streptantibioticus silvisoli]|uniref:sensor histidine kinase n=1 Tax=Streptantibioticus silvisoli TaxID=2705255 RepID=UPI0024A88802|nr:sensor histidine kinase [Streptantibioticus silvisoli]